MCEHCEGKGGKCEHCEGMMHGGKWSGKWMMMKHRGGKGMGGLYCVAFLGAAFYYVGQATTFWMGVLGILKAAVWPAMLIYKAFTLLGM